MSNTERNVERGVELQNAQIDAASAMADLKQGFMGLNDVTLRATQGLARLADIAEDISPAGSAAKDRGAEFFERQADRSVPGAPLREGPLTLPESSRLGTPAGVMFDQVGRKVSDLVSAITQSDATVSDLVTPYQGDENWVGDIAAYLNMSPDDVMPQTPEEIGKLAMALAGKQVSGEIQAGEDFRHEIRGALRSELGSVGEFEQGGVASGPTSGFFAELHGTEAVIPLNGGSIPVTISNLENQISGPINQLSERLAMTENMITETANRQQTREVVRENSDMTRTNREQLRAMQDQVSRLDRLINVSESNNNIMSKILQNSHA